MSNSSLQAALRTLGEKRGVDVFIPPLSSRLEDSLMSRLCTDNAAMIAWRGMQLFKSGRSIVREDALGSVRYDDHLSFPEITWD